MAPKDTLLAQKFTVERKS